MEVQKCEVCIEECYSVYKLYLAQSVKATFLVLGTPYLVTNKFEIPHESEQDFASVICGIFGAINLFGDKVRVVQTSSGTVEDKEF